MGQLLQRFRHRERDASGVGWLGAHALRQHQQAQNNQKSSARAPKEHVKLQQLSAPVTAH